jgi:cobalt-zinc-cadmium efflux system outer membrane protein
VLPLLALVLSSAPVTLDLAAAPDDAALVNLLWEHAPDLQLARTRVAAARADAQRALFLPNPNLDLSAGTLPIGPSNPAGLDQPWANTPNYAVAVSELIELGKRGPRQEATRQAVVATLYDARAQLTERYHDLEEAIGEVAASVRRVAQLTELVDDAGKLSAVQRARADKGDTALLDADRAKLEEQKLRASLKEQQARLLANLRACSQVAGLPCEPFADVAATTTWMQRLKGEYSPDAVEQRPDVLSLTAAAQSARASETLARAHAIPDPTVRVGYVRDQFVVSGNQQNSLFVGLSVPLPLFDHGQADAAAAAVAAESATRARAELVQIGRDAAQRFGAEADSLQSRRQQLNDETLPLARSVVSRLDSAVQRGGAEIQDLLLARRTLGELLLEAAEVDLTAFHLDVERSRTVGRLPVTPQALVLE